MVFMLPYWQYEEPSRQHTNPPLRLKNERLYLWIIKDGSKRWLKKTTFPNQMAN
jgi:hypothetical protein